MDVLANLLGGFQAAFSPTYLLICLLGVLLGQIVGALPGIGPSAAIALLLPITFGGDPTSALIMFAGIYAGSQYGGTLTSVLVNVPGEASGVMTAVDGHQMARQGRAGVALGIAAIGSFIAGTVGLVGLVLGSPACCSQPLALTPRQESRDSISDNSGCSTASNLSSSRWRCSALVRCSRPATWERHSQSSTRSDECCRRGRTGAPPVGRSPAAQ